MPILRGTAALGFLLASCLLCGLLWPARIRGGRLPRIFLLGFVTFLTGFHALALPMKLLNLPLHVLTLAVAAAFGLLVMFVFVFRRQDIREFISGLRLPGKESLPAAAYAVMFLVLSIALARNINHISTYDYSYYVGVPASSVYSDTIERMDPYTGEYLTERNEQSSFYLLNTWTVQTAVLYQAFDVDAMTLAQYTQTVFLLLVFFTALDETGRILVPESGWKGAAFGAASLAVLALTYSIYESVPMYFFYRTYEGKGITAYLVPLLIFLFVQICCEEEQYTGAGAAGISMLSVGSISLTNSALFLTPAAIGVFLFPQVIAHRRKRDLILLCAAMVVGILWILFHRYCPEVIR